MAKEKNKEKKKTTKRVRNANIGVARLYLTTPSKRTLGREGATRKRRGLSKFPSPLQKRFALSLRVPVRARPKFCDAPREAPSSGLQYVRVVIHLLRGDLAVAGVLGRAQRPGVGLGRALPPRPVADAAHQILDGRPHLLVLVGVDAGVHDRVEHGQQQQPALQLGHVALGAVEAVHQQDDQAGSPTHHKGPCNTAHGSIQV